MRNKIFILSQDLSFFYKLNKELLRLNVQFEILNVNSKIPTIPCIILTTSEEMVNFRSGNKVIFLPYSKNDNFEEYLLKVVAGYRIGYKDYYSDLLFSIDPGEKSGLMVFLDGYYLISHCCYKKSDLLYKITRYVFYFQKDNPELINLSFKFGRGILKMVQDLVKDVFNLFPDRKNMSVLLIDEYKSSQIKINNKDKERRITKDEVAALILALKNGVEVNLSNYSIIFNQIKSKKFKKEDLKFDIIKNTQAEPQFLSEVAEKILSGELSLKESINRINEKLLNVQKI
ncbi:MAG: hypothetical protein ACFFAO_04220 [Candidatus Hermodarchaeota archaeon]